MTCTNDEVRAASAGCCFSCSSDDSGCGQRYVEANYVGSETGCDSYVCYETIPCIVTELLLRVFTVALTHTVRVRLLLGPC